MAEQSLGNIILRLLVDNKAFKEGLVNSLELVKITSAQIKDLSQFKISAPDIKALDLALQTGEARVKDFIGAEAAIPELGPSVDETLGAAGKAHTDHAGKVATGEQALRGFFREQRLQDRTLGEARNAVVGLTGSLVPLISGQGAAGGATRLLGESLGRGIDTSNQMEFALFGIGQVGSKLPGVLGTIATSVGGLAGPISLAVGVGALLISFFKSANEESGKAADEGLKNFGDELNRLSQPQKLRLYDNVKEQFELVNKEIDKLQAGRDIGKAIQFAPPGVGSSLQSVSMLNEAEQKRLGLLEEDRNILGKILEDTDEQRKKAETLARAHKISEDNLLRVGTELQKHDILIGRITQEIEMRKNVETNEILTLDQLRAKNEQLVALQRERTQMLKTSLELSQDFVTRTETLYNLGKASDTLLVGSLEVLRQKQLAQGDLNGARETELKIQQTQQKLAADGVAIAEARRSLGLGTTADVVKALEVQKASRVLDADKLADQVRINAEIEKGVSLAVQRAERDRQRGIISSTQLIEAYQQQLAITKEKEKQAEIEQKIIDAEATELDYLQQMKRAREEYTNKLYELSQIATTNEFTARRTAEQHRFEQEKKSIEEKYRIVGVFEDDQVHLTQEGEDLRNANAEAHRRAEGQLERDTIQAQHELRNLLNEETYRGEVQSINDKYDEAERQARKVFDNEREYEAALAQLKKNRIRDLANAEFAAIQKTLGNAQTIASSINTIIQGITEPAEGFYQNFLKALEVAQAIVTLITTLKTIGMFFGLAGGGFVPPITYAATGTEIPGGSFVVKKSAVDQNRELLEALGAVEVTGGTPGKDSVYARTDLGGMVGMMPGEMIVPPVFSPIARAINDGRKLMLRAEGGVANWFAPVLNAVSQYHAAGLVPGTFPISQNLLQEIKQRMNGGFNKETVDALIEEVRGLRSDVNEMKSEIKNQSSSIDDQTSAVRDIGSIPAVVDREELRRGMKDIAQYERNKNL